MNDLTGKYVGNLFYLKQGVNPNYAMLRQELQIGYRHRYRYFILQGGTRSGKTYAICHFLWWVILNVTGLTISVVRKTGPALKATILRDFEDIGRSIGVWSDKDYNKTKLEYRLNGNLVEFFSTDQEQKVRGRKRDILICNEANELEREDNKQLLFRTTGFAIYDFNPSCVASYLYDDILERQDACLLITTYRDNPHLPASIIQEIEHLKITDPESYKIYGMGQRADALRGRIYTTWQVTESMPKDMYHWYGLDWGGTDPTAIACLCYDYSNNTLYVDEVCYRREIGVKTTYEIIQDYEKSHYESDTINEIYCDSENKVANTELRMYGVNAYPCIKGKGSVVDQIGFMKNFNVLYTSSSLNIKREVENYKWKEIKNSKDFENEPEQNGCDHLMDAIRYGAFTRLFRDTRVFRTIKEIKGQDKATEEENQQ